MKTKELKEVEKKVKSLSVKLQSVKEGSLYRYGIPVPSLRKALKEGYTFSKLNNSEQIEVWDYVWKNSVCFEAMSQALYFFQHKSLNKKEFGRVKTWIGRCECWEHSDDLSKIYARVVEENPDWIVPLLEKWNTSRSLWKRRQSVVSLLEYASKRKVYPSFHQMIKLVSNLLGDDEYYVQKGLGWTLREIHNVYPDETLNFFRDNLYKIDSRAYSAATEKLPLPVKAELKLKRREYRKNNL